MIELENAIADIIRKDVLNSQLVLEAVAVGDDVITIQDTASYPIGSQLAIREGSDSFICRVVCRLDARRIRIDTPSPFDMAASVFSDDAIEFHTTILPLIENQIVAYVVCGNPPAIPKYPSVTVENVDVQNEPMTLRTLKSDYRVVVRVWSEAATYDSSHRLIHKLAGKIEHCLFKAVTPLIEPYLCSTLAESIVTVDQTIIDVTDENLLIGATQAYLQDSFGLRQPIWIKQALGAGRYELTMPVGRSFVTGDRVVRPLTHVYDSLLEQISYGDGRDGDGVLLHFARLDYRLSINRDRYSEPFG